MRLPRRAVLQALGLGSVGLALQACMSTTLSPFSACSSLPTSPHQRIDAHVHIFNGTDLQVAGFLKKSVAPEYPKLKDLIGRIADPLQLFVWSNSPKASKELALLNTLHTQGGGSNFTTSNLVDDLQKARNETEAQYNEFLLQQLQRPEVLEPVRSLLPGTQLRGAEPFEQTNKLLIAPLRSASDARILAENIDLLSGIPFFGYLKPYFSYRFANYCEVVEKFACQGAPEIDTFVALLVDFDAALSTQTHPNTPSSINDQTAVVSKMCELTKGRLLAFVALHIKPDKTFELRKETFTAQVA